MKAEALDGSDLIVRSLLKGGRPAAAAALSTQYQVCTEYSGVGATYAYYA